MNFPFRRKYLGRQNEMPNILFEEDSLRTLYFYQFGWNWFSSFKTTNKNIPLTTGLICLFTKAILMLGALLHEY